MSYFVPINLKKSLFIYKLSFLDELFIFYFKFINNNTQ